MTGSVPRLEDMVRKLQSWLTFLPRITWRNIFEIIIIAFLVYEILKWIKNTRAWNLLQGILVILAFTFMSAVFHLDTILWILEKIATIAVVALLVIFQPELRKALEQLGSRNFLTGLLTFENRDNVERFTERTAAEIARACFEMSKVKTGALIVIERQYSLKEIERTGIAIDGLVSSQLLINIFEHNTPLHDGAVIVRGNHVAAATCYLPLSDNMMISKDLGTRHRAAVGISEITDSLTIVVSEETGRVSAVEGGSLFYVGDADALKKRLQPLTMVDENNANRFIIWKGKKRNEKKANE